MLFTFIPWLQPIHVLQIIFSQNCVYKGKVQLGDSSISVILPVSYAAFWGSFLCFYSVYAVMQLWVLFEKNKKKTAWVTEKLFEQLEMCFLLQPI